MKFFIIVLGGETNEKKEKSIFSKDIHSTIIHRDFAGRYFDHCSQKHDISPDEKLI